MNRRFVNILQRYLAQSKRSASDLERTANIGGGWYTKIRDGMKVTADKVEQLLIVLPDDVGRAVRELSDYDWRSPQAREAFDLSQEPLKVRERYGMNRHGQSVRVLSTGCYLEAKITDFWQLFLPERGFLANSSRLVWF